MHRWRANPRRCAYAWNASVGGGVTFPFASLFNDSSQYYLAVWDYGNRASANGTLDAWVISKGALGSSPVQGTCIISDEPPMPGQVRVGTVSALPLTFSLNASDESGTVAWKHDFPWIILKPGWSLTGYAQAANTTLSEYFWWEVLLPDMVINPTIGDPALDHEY